MTPRAESLDRLRARDVWDLVVVGGGATGLGAAVDAATRGYRTLLLEAHDFAKGTSSRSTKLIHGGVRYLASGQVGLVREALAERARLLRNAPHLVHDRRFMIPAYAWWETPYYGLGLWAYDRLAGSAGLAASHRVGRAEAVELAPGLRPERVRGGVVYHDGQFDDARLAVALARTADDHGATVLNAVGVERLLKDGSGAICGLVARDAETGEEFEVAARGVLNATGVFADDLCRLDEPDAAPRVTPSQGSHVVLDARFFPGETAALIPKTDDGRVLFMIPWQGKVVVGTTDTPVAAAAIEPRPLAEELDFLLGHAGRYLGVRPGPGDVLSTFAGLRPLIRPAGDGAVRTAGLSRGYEVRAAKSGLVTAIGGKWTTYRAMAEAAVALAATVAGLRPSSCRTADLPIHGAALAGTGGKFAAYGTDAPALEALCAEEPALAEPLHPRLTHVAAEVVWAARTKSARTVEDVLARRTRALFLDARAAAESAPRVAALLARELVRGDDWAGVQAEAFQRLAAGFVLSA